MRKINKQLSTLSIFITLMVIAVSAPAEEPAQKESHCDAKEAGQKEQNCTARLKRAQLKSKKLSPEIRAGKLDRDQEFDLNKLYPFIAGSGLVQ